MAHTKQSVFAVARGTPTCMGSNSRCRATPGGQQSEGRGRRQRDAVESDDDTRWWARTSGGFREEAAARQQARRDTYRLREKAGFKGWLVGGMEYHEQDCCGCRWQFSIEVLMKAG